MNLKTNTAVLAALAALGANPAMAADAAAPAQAQSFAEAITGGKPMTNFRLRYEYVDDDAKREEANAWTLRSLVGWQTKPFHDFSIGAQVIAVTDFNDDFDDFHGGVTEAGRTNHARVADPGNVDINQLYLDWSGIPSTKFRLGRQSVKLDNVRFIGNVEFRQVMQVFDGIAVTNTSLPNTELYLAYFDRVKQISAKLRQDNTTIAHAAYKLSPTETITAYAYLYDMENVSRAADNSTKTFGLRADGSHKINDNWKVLYTAEYAKQDDYRDGSSKIDNHYYKLGAGAGYGAWFARVDQELLSGNSQGKAFQTPLGTNHLFQGWVDKFLTTPAEGIRDTFITAGGKWKDITLLTEYHWINSDRDFAKLGGGTGDRYGTEWNVSAAYAYDKNISGKIEYGTYQEEDARKTSRVRDTDKLWLTVMYTF